MPTVYPRGETKFTNKLIKEVNTREFKLELDFSSKLKTLKLEMGVVLLFDLMRSKRNTMRCGVENVIRRFCILLALYTVARI